jgi:orotate phosphoribosyltransferase
MRNNKIVAGILDQMGAIKTGGHFVYTSGLHGPNYVAKDTLYTDPLKTFIVCNELAATIFHHCGALRINDIVVVSPVAGGVALSQWVTYSLLKIGGAAEKSFRASAVFADKDQKVVTLRKNESVKIGDEWQNVPDGASILLDIGSFIIKRNYGKLIKGKKVVVVEDVITTGKSVKGTIEAVTKGGGEVVMVAAICNRGGVTALDLDVPYLHSALNFKFETFDPKSPQGCPICQLGVIPINTEFGHGKKFLESKGE